MPTYWAGVPAALRAFYEKGFERDGWLESMRGKSDPAFRLGLMNVDISAQSQGPGTAQGAIATSWVSGIYPNRFQQAVDAGGGVADALAGAIKPTGGADKLGRKLTDVLAAQRALETAAMVEVAAKRTRPESEWPAPARVWLGRLRAVATPNAETLALFTFLREVGVGKNVAAGVAQNGTLPKEKATGRTLPGLALSRGPRAMFDTSLATHLVKPGPAVGGAVARDVEVADLGRGPVPYLLGAVLVAGLYVLARRFGG